MTIYKPKFERTNEAIEVKAPTEPLYYFQSRRAVRVIPEFTTWNMERFNKPEEVWRYDCTVVHNEFLVRIERFHIEATESAFQRVLDYKSDRAKHTIQEEIYYKIINFPDDDLRTNERFEADFKCALEKILNTNEAGEKIHNLTEEWLTKMGIEISGIKKPLSELVNDSDTCNEICELLGCSGVKDTDGSSNKECLSIEFYDGCFFYIYKDGELGFEDMEHDTVNIPNAIKISKLLDSKYIFQ